ncbi:MAG: hypothetical protein V3V34_04170 [Kiloniellales bacterium]
MTKPPKKGAKGASAKAPGAAGAGRQERLAAALRENLRRRKAQARGRAASEAAPEAEPGGEKRDSGGSEP